MDAGPRIDGGGGEPRRPIRVICRHTHTYSHSSRHHISAAARRRAARSWSAIPCFSRRRVRSGRGSGSRGSRVAHAARCGVRAARPDNARHAAAAESQRSVGDRGVGISATSQRRLRAQVRCDGLVVRADRVVERRAAPAIDPVHIGARLPLGYTHLGAWPRGLGHGATDDLGDTSRRSSTRKRTAPRCPSLAARCSPVRWS